MHANFISVLVIATMLGFAAAQPVDVKSTVVKRDGILGGLGDTTSSILGVHTEQASAASAENTHYSDIGHDFKADGLEYSDHNTQYDHSKLAAAQSSSGDLYKEDKTESALPIVPGIL